MYALHAREREREDGRQRGRENGRERETNTRFPDGVSFQYPEKATHPHPFRAQGSAILRGTSNVFTSADQRVSSEPSTTFTAGLVSWVAAEAVTYDAKT